MSKRYYISKVVGVGTLRDPQRAILDDIKNEHGRFPYSAMIPTDPNSGVALTSTCFCRVERDDHGLLLSARYRGDLTPLPEVENALGDTIFREGELPRFEPRVEPTAKHQELIQVVKDIHPDFDFRRLKEMG